MRISQTINVTSTIVVAHIWESPETTQVNTESYHSQNELHFLVPGLSVLNLTIIKQGKVRVNFQVFLEHHRRLDIFLPGLFNN